MWASNSQIHFIHSSDLGDLLLIVICFLQDYLKLNLATVETLRPFNAFCWIVSFMTKPEGNFFKNWKVCLRKSLANTLNKPWFRFCYVGRNHIYQISMCTTSISSMQCRLSFVGLRDCTVTIINTLGKILLPQHEDELDPFFLSFLSFVFFWCFLGTLCKE